MMICKNCHAIFSEPSTYYDRSTGAYDEDCPECGSEDIEDAVICPICKEWRPNDEADIIESEGKIIGCEQCKDEYTTILSDFLATHSAAAVQMMDSIIEGEGLMKFWREN